MATLSLPEPYLYCPETGSLSLSILIIIQSNRCVDNPIREAGQYGTKNVLITPPNEVMAGGMRKRLPPALLFPRVLLRLSSTV
jgi:hypothetical protein